MDEIALAIIMTACIFVGWLFGIRWAPPENPNVTVSENIVKIKDCKDITLDTVSYNFMDSTYVMQVNIK